MNRPGCNRCRFNQRASDAADMVCNSIVIFLMTLTGVQLWFVYLARKAFPQKYECRDHRKS
jgi:hypothetical protein